mgnify:CR=1 FL=1|jgi:Ca2+-binding RTX toxin-like protein
MADDTLYGVMTLFQTSFEQVPSGNDRMAYFKDWIDQCADLGAEVIRLPGDWRMLEENGNNAWAQWYVDETVELIGYAGQKGISVIYEFAQTPDWAMAGGGSSNVWSYPQNVNQFGQAAAYLHQKFIDAGVDDNVVAWEIWNEPNVKAFWPDGSYRNPDGASDGTDIAVNKAACLDYVNLLNAAYDALKAVDPDVTVLGGSLAGTDFEYAEWMLKAGARFDGLSVHPYTRPFEPSDPTPAEPTDDPTDDPEVGSQSTTLNERWSFEYGIERIHDLLVEYNRDDGIWLTEMGWRLPHNSSWTYVPDEQTQADYLQSALELIRDWDFLRAVTIFNLYDAGDGDFGLLRPDGSWRPAATVLHDFIANPGNPGDPAGPFHLSGTSGDDMLIGRMNRSNDIEGFGGNDYIEAGNLADLIDGGKGDDVIVARSGAHLVNGGGGEDTFALLARNADFSISETADGLLIGRDGFSAMLSHVEWVVFDARNGNFSINVGEFLGHGSDISGTDLDDTVSGTARDEFLYGLDGADRLSGGAGGDIMFGGNGDDIYVVDNVHDMVVENADEGHDLIRSSVSTSISFLGQVEDISLTGRALRAVGNEADNEITGNGRNNRLGGGGGDDVLVGGGGHDRLTGGSGADQFVFATASGQDVIRDFAAGADVIDLSAIAEISDMANLLAHHMAIQGSSAIISWGDGQSVTIANIASKEMLAESDFLFA